jgi:hypothetical protein
MRIGDYHFDLQPLVSSDDSFLERLLSGALFVDHFVQLQLASSVRTINVG